MRAPASFVSPDRTSVSIREYSCCAAVSVSIFGLWKWGIPVSYSVLLSLPNSISHAFIKLAYFCINTTGWTNGICPAFQHLTMWSHLWIHPVLTGGIIWKIRYMLPRYDPSLFPEDSPSSIVTLWWDCYDTLHIKSIKIGYVKLTI